MSVSDRAVRDAVGRVLTELWSLHRATRDEQKEPPAHAGVPPYLRGQANARLYDIAIIRRELADYLPEEDAS